MLFGTDGIRGKAGSYPLDSSTMELAGKAAGSILTGKGKKAIIAKDTRASGDDIEAALAAGLTAQGVDVDLAGYSPTPALAYLTKNLGYDFGIMITASHNPASDNGVKFFGPDGFKISDEQERAIEGVIDGSETAPEPAADTGATSQLDDAVDKYADYASTTGPTSLEGLKIVVDCSHGGAYKIAPAILKGLGADVTSIGVDPDGMNINAGVGSQQPEKAVAAVKEAGADIGIIYDGDADRVILCDEQGEVFDGDNILMVIALHFKEQQKLQKDTLVVTSMSNIGLEKACQQNGINLIRTDVGDIAVVREMRKGGYNLGGEQSGHIICLDHTSTGDGIIACLQILDIMQQKQKKLSELRAFTPSPQILRGVKIQERTNLDQFPNTLELVDQFNSSEDTRVNLRYSGTELLLRIMVEGSSEEEINNVADQIQRSYEHEVTKLKGDQ